MLPAAVRRRLDPAGRFGLRLTLAVLALVLVAVPFGFLLDQVVRDGPLVEVDTSAANHLHGWVRESPVAVEILEIVTFLGDPVWFYVIVTLAAIHCFRRHHLRLVVYLATTTLLGGLVDTLVKVLVNRDRPSLENPVASAHGKSFPSGHAMTSTVAYGALLLVYLPVLPRAWRKWFVVAYAVVVGSVAFSRLALGVHYISDVLGGIVLGLAWLALSTAAFSIWRVERGKPPVTPMEGVEPEAAKDLTPKTTTQQGHA